MTDNVNANIVCSLSQTILFWTHAIISYILVLFVIYVLCTIISTRNEEQTLRTDRITGYIFIIFTILGIACHGTYTVLECYDTEYLFYIVLAMYNLSFGVQSYLLLLIFFNKLKAIFNRSPRRLSNLTKACYNIMFVVLPLYMVVTIAIYVIDPAIVIESLYFGVIFLILFIALITSLAILFIYKLLSVYKCNAINLNQYDPELVAVITKTTILMGISVTTTLIDTINTIISDDNSVYAWICYLITTVDLFTNFLCIMLQFKPFKHYYILLCSCFDTKCRLCWASIAQSQINVSMQTSNTSIIINEIEV
eukprot:244520_1